MLYELKAVLQSFRTIRQYSPDNQSSPFLQRSAEIKIELFQMPAKIAE